MVFGYKEATKTQCFYVYLLVSLVWGEFVGCNRESELRSSRSKYLNGRQLMPEVCVAIKIRSDQNLLQFLDKVRCVQFESL